jgi:dUTP pyrophosphatase
VNAPGLIDSGYRGEVKVCLMNTDQEHEFRIVRGDRIAQIVVQRYLPVDYVRVDSLDETDRGSNGFGSTGVN